MAISFTFDDEDVVWTQRFDRPAVYLDTFAIRTIAESDVLSEQFVQALKSNNGTWLLATVSMGEFARFADARHVEGAERLLAMALPNIYVFLAEPDSARIARGDTDTATRSLPPADRRNLDWFARRWAQVQSLPETFQGMFRAVYDNRAGMTATLNEVVTKVAGTLNTYRQDPSYRKNAKAARPDDGRTRQQIIAGDLMRDLVLDTRAPITTNDVLDLMHAVDAVDHCDLVMLDKGWERRVNALRLRISTTEVSMPVARCFSRRNGGLEKFLTALQQWPD